VQGDPSRREFLKAQRENLLAGGKVGRYKTILKTYNFHWKKPTKSRFYIGHKDGAEVLKETMTTKPLSKMN